MAHSSSPTLSDEGFLFLLHEAQARATLRKNVQVMNAYMVQQEVTASELTLLSLEDLRQTFEAASDGDVAWEIACAIADIIGFEEAEPYFTRANALE